MAFISCDTVGKNIQKVYITAKKKGCFDLIWLPQFHTSSASLNTVETH